MDPASSGPPQKSSKKLPCNSCTGGGHLGLLVAHLAPSVMCHMVENKEESLARARARGIEMGLKNVWFYQCNLEFYVGNFNIGTCARVYIEELN